MTKIILKQHHNNHANKNILFTSVKKDVMDEIYIFFDLSIFFLGETESRGETEGRGEATKRGNL